MCAGAGAHLVFGRVSTTAAGGSALGEIVVRVLTARGEVAVGESGRTLSLGACVVERKEEEGPKDAARKRAGSATSGPGASEVKGVRQL